MKNQKKDRKLLPNSPMGNAHAEVGALQQAANKGLTEGADAVMKVTGKDIYGYCQKDIVAMAKASGLKSLKVYAKEDKTHIPKIYEWRAGMDKFAERKVQ
ncbi:cytidine deaminase-like fold-containing protein [Snodgrassella alvi]|uniref:cytidine deaminase-like fold-containing protein n=1 Tax=Snodgrassella alvi TaxID=1196083 RepID=UPI00403CE417